MSIIHVCGTPENTVLRETLMSIESPEYIILGDMTIPSMYMCECELVHMIMQHYYVLNIDGFFIWWFRKIAKSPNWKPCLNAPPCLSFSLYGNLLCYLALALMISVPWFTDTADWIIPTGKETKSDVFCHHPTSSGENGHPIDEGTTVHSAGKGTHISLHLYKA